MAMLNNQRNRHLRSFKNKENNRFGFEHNQDLIPVGDLLMGPNVVCALFVTARCLACGLGRWFQNPLHHGIAAAVAS